MRFLKLSYELITDKNITANEFRIYTYLLSLYNETKKCAYPSIDTISNNLKISIATVKRSIKRLVELGYMVIEKRKGEAGNYNTYRELKHIINDIIDIKKKVIKKVSSDVSNVKNEKVIVSDCKESGVQIEIEEFSPYTIEHQQKISLVLKQGIRLTEKQMFLIGEMDLELLRKAIHQFKKKNGKYFSLLLAIYIDKAEEVGAFVSRDIEKFLKGNYIRLTPEERETQEALKELEMYGVPYGHKK